jgi:hypothetical protein
MGWEAGRLTDPKAKLEAAFGMLYEFSTVVKISRIPSAKSKIPAPKNHRVIC